MAYAATPEERDALERASELIRESMERLVDEVSSLPEGGLDEGYVARFVDTSKRLALEVDQELGPDIDPGALAEVRGHIIKILELLLDIDEERPLDTIDELLVRAEAIRHVLRDALDGQAVRDERDARALLGAIDEWLPRINQQDKAALIGVSPRTLQRIAVSGGQPGRRMIMVARLVALLHRGWTPEGVVAWFHRSRDEFGGRPPIELLDDPDLEGELLRAARRGRALHGS